MLEAQNKRIDDLVNRIRLQQDKLDKQNVRIRTLQNQVWNTVNFNIIMIYTIVLYDLFKALFSCSLRFS